MRMEGDVSMDRPVVLGGDPIGRIPVATWPIADAAEVERVRAVVSAGSWADHTPTAREFEARFRDLQTASYGWSVANGTVAIQLALEALDVGVGDEVIVPGLTWQATAAAVLDINAVPVLVDVEPDTYCIDPLLVEEAITERTKGIIIVHLYDSLTDMDRIEEIAQRHNLWSSRTVPMLMGRPGVAVALGRWAPPVRSHSRPRSL